MELEKNSERPETRRVHIAVTWRGHKIKWVSPEMTPDVSKPKQPEGTPWPQNPNDPQGGQQGSGPTDETGKGGAGGAPQ